MVSREGMANMRPNTDPTASQPPVSAVSAPSPVAFSIVRRENGMGPRIMIQRMAIMMQALTHRNILLCPQ
ncbi:hypothetical protein LBMAG45_14690 [Nitrospirota bacterium]|nr:hypothetical protein LBMAG45_14690 [Nitrospirota bacterium]